MKETRWLISVLLFLSCAFLLSTRIEAFDNKETHPKITESAVKSSKLESVLTRTIGLGGLNDSINNKPIIKWLTEGATAEDIPMCRADSHFHDPTRNMGLSDVIYSAADPVGILMPGPSIFIPGTPFVGKGFLAYCTVDGVHLLQDTAAIGHNRRVV